MLSFLRYLVECWLMSAFLLGVSYAGVLRAWLITPEYAKPINTIQDVVDSGLPWKVVLYGTTFERILDQTQVEPYVTFWKNKEATKFNDFPLETVCITEAQFSVIRAYLTTTKAMKYLHIQLI